MIDEVVAAFPNFKVAATTLRKATTATVNDWGGDPLRRRHVLPGDDARDLEIYDRVGGGDGFASGLVYGFLDGKPPQPPWSTAPPTARSP